MLRGGKERVAENISPLAMLLLLALGLQRAPFPCHKGLVRLEDKPASLGKRGNIPKLPNT